MGSTVFFTTMATRQGNSLEHKFIRMLRKTGIEGLISPGDLVAIKVHVGEQQNLGYLNQNYARLVVEEVKKAGGKPFLTDTNTLYTGGRHNGVDHAVTALHHGYSYTTTGAPFIPADGIRGTEYTNIAVKGRHFSSVKLASGILSADKIIFLSHFKGHLEAGFGGSLKNMAMGCASIAGKMEQHSNAIPLFNEAKCTGCRQCVLVCPSGALTMKGKKASLDKEKCIGCGQCVAACNYEALTPDWGKHQEEFIERVGEYALGVYQHFADRAIYFNFATNITPDCDCWPVNEPPLVEDVGFFASTDPFALDSATLEKVNEARRMTTSRFWEKTNTNTRLFQGVYPHINDTHVFTHLSELGVHFDDYQLEKLP
ncbi:MAG: DUF362 domain-containing protein [Spirochaetales bacterium]|nr:DUF362 domain-containing protein [Spirochaetales bacterium]